MGAVLKGLGGGAVGAGLGTAATLIGAHPFAIPAGAAIGAGHAVGRDLHNKGARDAATHAPHMDHGVAHSTPHSLQTSKGAVHSQRSSIRRP